MANDTLGLLGESFALPGDLAALAEDSFGGFPSRPTALPDELRGALLLPSESASSSSVAASMKGAGDFFVRGAGDSSSFSKCSCVGLSSSSGSTNRVLRCLVADAKDSEAPPSLADASLPPRPSSGIGLGGAREESNGTSPCSTSTKTRTDWSLSDTDLAELLDAQSPVPEGPEGGGGATAGANLSSAPETHELAEDVASGSHVGALGCTKGPPSGPRSGALPSRDLPPAPASGSAQHSPAQSAASRSQAATSASTSPPQSSPSSYVGHVTARGAAARGSAGQHLAAGAGPSARSPARSPDTAPASEAELQEAEASILGSRLSL